MRIGKTADELKNIAQNHRQIFTEKGWLDILNAEELSGEEIFKMVRNYVRLEEDFRQEVSDKVAEQASEAWTDSDVAAEEHQKFADFWDKAVDSDGRLDAQLQECFLQIHRESLEYNTIDDECTPIRDLSTRFDLPELASSRRMTSPEKQMIKRVGNYVERLLAFIGKVTGRDRDFIARVSGIGGRIIGNSTSSWNVCEKVWKKMSDKESKYKYCLRPFK